MTIGSLFSGIGGLELGLEWAGLGPVLWQVEASPFCRSVLERHWPHVERFDDVRTVGAAELAPVDLICGGFPCQDISSAGKGAGLAGSRSGLWSEFARLISELQPRWVVIENVASGAKRWVDEVVRQLAERQYEPLPVPLSAADVGAPHRRARVFIVAHSSGEPLRQQPGRSSRAHGASAPLAGLAGDHGPIANTNRQGKSVEPKHGEVGGVCAAPEPANTSNTQLQGQRVTCGVRAGIVDPRSPWTEGPPVPPVCGVDDGIPNRVQRLRALGNAVVPRCAEVIGWVVRELEGV